MKAICAGGAVTEGCVQAAKDKEIQSTTLQCSGKEKLEGAKCEETFLGKGKKAGDAGDSLTCGRLAAGCGGGGGGRRGPSAGGRRGLPGSGRRCRMGKKRAGRGIDGQMSPECSERAQRAGRGAHDLMSETLMGQKQLYMADK